MPSSIAVPLFIQPFPQDFSIIGHLKLKASISVNNDSFLIKLREYIIVDFTIPEKCFFEWSLKVSIEMHNKSRNIGIQWSIDTMVVEKRHEKEEIKHVLTALLTMLFPGTDFRIRVPDACIFL